MATIFSIKELDVDSSNLNEEWKRWRQTIELVLQGPLADKSEKQQCELFLLYVGQPARDVYNIG